MSRGVKGRLHAGPSAQGPPQPAGSAAALAAEPARLTALAVWPGGQHPPPHGPHPHHPHPPSPCTRTHTSVRAHTHTHILLEHAPPSPPQPTPSAGRRRPHAAAPEPDADPRAQAGQLHRLGPSLHPGALPGAEPSARSARAAEAARRQQRLPGCSAPPPPLLHPMDSGMRLGPCLPARRRAATQPQPFPSLANKRAAER